MSKVALCGTSTGAAKTGSSANPGYISHSHTITSGTNRTLVVGVAILGEYGSTAFSVSSATFSGVSMTKAGSITRFFWSQYDINFQTTTEIWYVYESTIGSTYANSPISGTVTVNFNKNLSGAVNASTASASFSNVSTARSPLYYSAETWGTSGHTMLLPLTYYDNGYMFDLFAVDIQCYINQQYQTVITRKNSTATGSIATSNMSSIFSTMETLDEPRWGDSGSGEPDNAWSFYGTYTGTASSPPPSFDPAYSLNFNSMARSAVMLWPNVADYYITGKTSFVPSAESLAAGATPTSVKINTDHPTLTDTVNLGSSIGSISPSILMTPMGLIARNTIVKPTIIVNKSDWWNNNYAFRNLITITPNYETIPSTHHVEFSFDKSYMDQSVKCLSDYSDIIVVYQNNEYIYPVPTNVEYDENFVYVSFLPEQDIETVNANYYVYYGNLKQSNLYAKETFPDLDWPLTSSYQERAISYVRPGDLWIDGTSSTAGASASITLPIKAVRIFCNKSKDSGILQVSIDGGEWVSYDLFNPTDVTSGVFSTTSLEPSVDEDGNTDYYHRINMRISQEKNPASSGHKVSFYRVDYKLDFDVSISTEEVYDYGWSIV